MQLVYGDIEKINSHLFEIKAIAWDWDNTIEQNALSIKDFITNFIVSILFKNRNLKKNINYVKNNYNYTSKCPRDLYNWLVFEQKKLIKQQSILCVKQSLKWNIFFPKYIRGLKKIYRQSSKLTSLTPGARELINYFKSRNIPQYIVSNGSYSIRKYQISQAGLNKHFSAIYAEGSPAFPPGEYSKLDALYRIKCKNRLLPQNIVMIGNSVNDIMAAKHVGVLAIGLANAKEDVAKLRCVNADLIVYKDFRKYNKILSILLRENLWDVRKFRFSCNNSNKIFTKAFAESILLVKGGNTLTGEVSLSGSKHSILMVLGALLLVRGTIVLENFPDITDAHNMLEIYRSFGIECLLDKGKSRLILNISSKNLKYTDKKIAYASLLRSSILLLGSALLRLKYIKFPFPGGDQFGGLRSITHFLTILDGFGISHAILNNKFNLLKLKLKRHYVVIGLFVWVITNLKMARL